MAGKFVLTAEIQIRAPKNLRQVAQNIRSSLGGKTAEVKVEVKGANKSAADVAKVEKAVEKAGDAAKRSQGQFDALGKSIGSAVLHVARYDIARRIVVGFSNALRVATKDAIAFEREIIKVAQVTEQSVSSLKFLNDEITRLSIGFGVSSKSLVKTTRILAQAGLTAKQTKQALEALAKTTLAPTFDDITSTTETSIAVMSQFGIEASKLESVLGKINRVAGSFAVEAGDLGTTIRRTGGVFKSAGGSVEELIALFTSVRSTTRETAETIATGFRTIFTRLQRPTTLKFLRQFGIELQDLGGKFVGPFEAVKRLHAALKDLDPRDVRYAQITEQLGGFRQVSKVIPLIQQFEKAQKAYNVALSGGNSLAKDAQVAQQGLGVQITKVKEEFTALIRKISEDSVFRGMITILTNMAGAFIRVADSIKPLIPLITAFASFSLAKGIGRFALGRSGGGGGRGGGIPGVFGARRGGVVPGRGSGDNVPAMLEPGEFVIRKSAVQSIGTKSLGRMNRAAKGGRIRRKFQGGGTPTSKRAEDFGNKRIRDRVVQKPFDKRRERLAKGELYNAEDKFTTGVSVSKVGIYNSDLRQMNSAWTSRSKINNEIQFGNKFEKFAIGKRKLTDLNVNDPNSPLDASRGTQLYEVKGYVNKRNYSRPEILQKRLQHEIQFGGTKGTFSNLTAGKDPSGTKDRKSQGVSLSNVIVLEPRFLGQRRRKSATATAGAARKGGTTTGRRQVAEGGAIGFAGGGAVDNVPALLTPGEFVFNRESAQKIGYKRLSKMNKYARGGPVQKLNGGGFPMTTGQPGVPTSSPAAKVDKLGKSAEKGSRDILGMVFAVSMLAESFVKTDGTIKKLIESGTQLVLGFTLLNALFKSDLLAQGFINLTKHTDKSSDAAIAAGGKLGALAAFAGAAALALHTFGKQVRREQIAAGGEKRASAPATAAAFGAGAGLAGGAAAGLAVAGGITLATGGAGLPVGVVAGIATAFAVSLATALGFQGFYEAAKEVRAANFKDSVEKLNKTMISIGKGRSSPLQAIRTFDRTIDEMRKIVAEGGQGERSELRPQIAQTQKQVSELLSIIAKDVTSFDQLGKAVLDTINKLAVLAGIPTSQIKADLVDQIETQNKSRISLEKLTKAIQSTFITLQLQHGLSRTFKELTARVKESARQFEVFNTLASGRFKVATPKPLGRLVQNPGDIVEFKAFEKEIDTIDKLLADNLSDLADDFGEKISGPAKRVGQVLSDLPAVLLKAAQTGNLPAGTNIKDIIIDFLGLDADLKSDRAIINALVKGLGGLGDDVAGAIRNDLSGTQDKIAKALEPLLKPYAEAAKFINAANKQYAAVLQQRGDLELKVAQEEVQLQKIRLMGLKAIAQVSGRGLSRAQVEQELKSQRQALLGAGQKTDVTSVVARFLAVGKALRDNQTALEAGRISRQKATDESARLGQEFAKLSLVVKDYANLQKQLGDLQRRASELRSQRENKLSILQGAAFGSLENLRNIGENLRATQRLGEGALITPGDPRNAGLLQFMRQFGNTRLPMFGQLTQPELDAQELTREDASKRPGGLNRTQEELVKFQVFRLLQKGGAQFDANQQKQLLGGVGSDEQKLQVKVLEATKAAMDAQKGLLKSLGIAHNTLNNLLAKQNRQFLVEMRILFRQNLVDQANVEKAKILSDVKVAEKRVEGINKIPGLLAEAIVAGPDVPNRPPEKDIAAKLTRKFATESGKAFLKAVTTGSASTVQKLRDIEKELRLQKPLRETLIRTTGVGGGHLTGGKQVTDLVHLFRRLSPRRAGDLPLRQPDPKFPQELFDRPDWLGRTPSSERQRNVELRVNTLNETLKALGVGSLREGGLIPKGEETGEARVVPFKEQFRSLQAFMKKPVSKEISENFLTAITNTFAKAGLGDELTRDEGFQKFRDALEIASGTGGEFPALALVNFLRTGVKLLNKDFLRLGKENEAVMVRLLDKDSAIGKFLGGLNRVRPGAANDIIRALRDPKVAEALEALSGTDIDVATKKFNEANTKLKTVNTRLDRLKAVDPEKQPAGAGVIIPLRREEPGAVPPIDIGGLLSGALEAIRINTGIDLTGGGARKEVPPGGPMSGVGIEPEAAATRQAGVALRAAGGEGVAASGILGQIQRGPGQSLFTADVETHRLLGLMLGALGGDGGGQRGGKPAKHKVKPPVAGIPVPGGTIPIQNPIAHGSTGGTIGIQAGSEIVESAGWERQGVDRVPAKVPGTNQWIALQQGEGIIPTQGVRKYPEVYSALVMSGRSGVSNPMLDGMTTGMQKGGTVGLQKGGGLGSNAIQGQLETASELMRIGDIKKQYEAYANKYKEQTGDSLVGRPPINVAFPSRDTRDGGVNRIDFGSRDGGNYSDKQLSLTAHTKEDGTIGFSTKLMPIDERMKRLKYPPQGSQGSTKAFVTGEPSSRTQAGMVPTAVHFGTGESITNFGDHTLTTPGKITYPHFVNEMSHFLSDPALKVEEYPDANKKALKSRNEAIKRFRGMSGSGEALHRAQDRAFGMKIVSQDQRGFQKDKDIELYSDLMMQLLGFNPVSYDKDSSFVGPRQSSWDALRGQTDEKGKASLEVVRKLLLQSVTAGDVNRTMDSRGMTYPNIGRQKGGTIGMFGGKSSLLKIKPKPLPDSSSLTVGAGELRYGKRGKILGRVKPDSPFNYSAASGWSVGGGAFKDALESNALEPAVNKLIVESNKAGVDELTMQERHVLATIIEREYIADHEKYRKMIESGAYSFKRHDPDPKLPRAKKADIGGVGAVDSFSFQEWVSSRGKDKLVETGMETVFDPFTIGQRQLDMVSSGTIGNVQATGMMGQGLGGAHYLNLATSSIRGGRGVLSHPGGDMSDSPSLGAMASYLSLEKYGMNLVWSPLMKGRVEVVKEMMKTAKMNPDYRWTPKDAEWPIGDTLQEGMYKGSAPEGSLGRWGEMIHEGSVPKDILYRHLQELGGNVPAAAVAIPTTMPFTEERVKWFRGLTEEAGGIDKLEEALGIQTTPKLSRGGTIGLQGGAVIGDPLGLQDRTESFYAERKNLFKPPNLPLTRKGIYNEQRDKALGTDRLKGLQSKTGLGFHTNIPSEPWMKDIGYGGTEKKVDVRKLIKLIKENKFKSQIRGEYGYAVQASSLSKYLKRKNLPPAERAGAEDELLNATRMRDIQRYLQEEDPRKKRITRTMRGSGGRGAKTWEEQAKEVEKDLKFKGRTGYFGRLPGDVGGPRERTGTPFKFAKGGTIGMFAGKPSLLKVRRPPKPPTTGVTLPSMGRSLSIRGGVGATRIAGPISKLQRSMAVGEGVLLGREPSPVPRQIKAPIEITEELVRKGSRLTGFTAPGSGFHLPDLLEEEQRIVNVLTGLRGAAGGDPRSILGGGINIRSQAVPANPSVPPEWLPRAHGAAFQLEFGKFEAQLRKPGDLRDPGSGWERPAAMPGTGIRKLKIPAEYASGLSRGGKRGKASEVSLTAVSIEEYLHALDSAAKETSLMGSGVERGHETYARLYDEAFGLGKVIPESVKHLGKDPDAGSWLMTLTKKIDPVTGQKNRFRQISELLIDESGTGRATIVESARGATGFAGGSGDAESLMARIRLNDWMQTIQEAGGTTRAHKALGMIHSEDLLEPKWWQKDFSKMSEAQQTRFIQDLEYLNTPEEAFAKLTAGYETTRLHGGEDQALQYLQRIFGKSPKGLEKSESFLKNWGGIKSDFREATMGSSAQGKPLSHSARERLLKGKEFRKGGTIGLAEGGSPLVRAAASPPSHAAVGTLSERFYLGELEKGEHDQLRVEERMEYDSRVQLLKMMGGRGTVDEKTRKDLIEERFSDEAGKKAYREKMVQQLLDKGQIPPDPNTIDKFVDDNYRAELMTQIIRGSLKEQEDFRAMTKISLKDTRTTRRLSEIEAFAIDPGMAPRVGGGYDKGDYPFYVSGERAWKGVDSKTGAFKGSIWKKIDRRADDARPKVHSSVMPPFRYLESVFGGKGPGDFDFDIQGQAEWEKFSGTYKMTAGGLTIRPEEILESSDFDPKDIGSIKDIWKFHHGTSPNTNSEEWMKFYGDQVNYRKQMREMAFYNQNVRQEGFLESIWNMIPKKKSIAPGVFVDDPAASKNPFGSFLGGVSPKELFEEPPSSGASKAEWDKWNADVAKGREGKHWGPGTTFSANLEHGAGKAGAPFEAVFGAGRGALKSLQGAVGGGNMLMGEKFFMSLAGEDRETHNDIYARENLKRFPGAAWEKPADFSAASTIAGAPPGFAPAHIPQPNEAMRAYLKEENASYAQRMAGMDQQWQGLSSEQQQMIIDRASRRINKDPTFAETIPEILLYESGAQALRIAKIAKLGRGLTVRRGASTLGGRPFKAKSAMFRGKTVHETLGIAEDATQAEMKAAFKANLIKHHPDSGGAPGAFNDVREAGSAVGLASGGTIGGFAQGGRIPSNLRGFVPTPDWAKNLKPLPGIGKPSYNPFPSANVHPGPDLPPWETDILGQYLHGPGLKKTFPITPDLPSYRSIVPKTDSPIIDKLKQGPGMRRGGEVPIMGHKGEFMIRKSAADALGTNFLNDLNKYQTGGLITAAGPSGGSNGGGGGGGGAAIVDIDAITNALRTEFSTLISGLQQAAAGIGAAGDKISNAEIKGTLSHKQEVNVNHNGAQVFNSMGEQFAGLANNAMQGALDQVSDTLGMARTPRSGTTANIPGKSKNTRTG